MANLTISLSVTTTSAGSGFYGQLLIGDPPPPPVVASTFDTYAHLLGATTPAGPITLAQPDTPANSFSGLTAGTAMARKTLL